MKYLNKLGLILGAGGMSALIFSLAACGEDTPDGGAAGSGTAGSSAGNSTAGTSAGNTSAGTANGGSSSGSGGSSAGTASKAGSGGMSGGSGGAGGMSGGSAGAGGSGGGGGGNEASAECKHWCSGAMGVIQTCAGMLGQLTTEDDCLARCAKSPAGDITCWNMHLDNINVKNMSKADHCPHAVGSMLCNAPPNP